MAGKFIGHQSAPALKCLTIHKPVHFSSRKTGDKNTHYCRKAKKSEEKKVSKRLTERKEKTKEKTPLF